LFVRGTLFVLLGRTEDAEKDLAKLRRLNPALAEQLAQTIRTGVEKKNAW
jgi:hypothetical protein